MDLNASDGIQIGVGVVLTLTLGAVLWYACETRKQAKATVKLAQAALRPVILLWIDKILLAELKAKPIILHYRNFGNGLARNLEWKADPNIGRWKADGEWKDKVTRVGMGVHDEEAPIEYHVQADVTNNGLSVDYDDTPGTHWRTTLKLVVKEGSIGNGETTIEKLDNRGPP